MSDAPDLHELVGDDLPEEERARLERVHDLLVAAGPPPELPPALAEPVLRRPEASVSFLPRRRAGLALALAAAVALVAFLGGFLAGRTRDSFQAQWAVSMQGTSAAPGASGKIDVGKADASGNWPLRVVVRSLPQLPRGAYYDMYLTKNGRPIASCGTFTVSGSTATIHLNAPYRLRGYDGWVVMRETRGTRSRAVFLRTSQI